MVPLLWAALKPPITATVFAVMVMHGSMREFSFLENPLYLLYHGFLVSVATSGFKILRLLP